VSAFTGPGARGAAGWCEQHHEGQQGCNGYESTVHPHLNNRSYFSAYSRFEIRDTKSPAPGNGASGGRATSDNFGRLLFRTVEAVGSRNCQGWQPRGALWGEGRAEIKGIFHTPGPVPGTDMEIGMQGWQPAGGSERWPGPGGLWWEVTRPLATLW